MNSATTFDLDRFVHAQQASYDAVISELRAGRKRTHWMWFIFPQVTGLGTSPMATRYAISSTDEARAYLAHPVLGPRLIGCAEAVLAIRDKSADEIFGAPDDRKLRSSATLFAHISPTGSVFHRIIDKYYSSEADPLTLDILRAESE